MAGNASACKPQPTALARRGYSASRPAASRSGSLESIRSVADWGWHARGLQGQAPRARTDVLVGPV